MQSSYVNGLLYQKIMCVFIYLWGIRINLHHG
jgi:hypothetical protein